MSTQPSPAEGDVYPDVSELVVLPRDALMEFFGEMALPP